MTTEKDALEREITGEAVTVRLNGMDYPLSFPAHNVALYTLETQKLNCRRAKTASDAGRARFSLAETRELKAEYRRLANELDQFKDDPDQFGILMEELIVIRVRLDEEAGTGDSLFQLINWWKIRDSDPERTVLALWAALHAEQSSGRWESPFTVAQLEKLVDMSNVKSVLVAIATALHQHMPQVKDDAVPNAKGPGANAPAEANEKALEEEKTMVH